MIPLVTVIENASHAIIEARKVGDHPLRAAHSSIRADGWSIMTSIVVFAFREADEAWSTLSHDERRMSA